MTTVDNGIISTKALPKMPLLTREEEYALGRDIQEGASAKEKKDNGETLTSEESARAARYEKAFETLFMRNVRLVSKIVGNYQNRYNCAMTFDDLSQEGYIGLMTAIRKYDPERGNKFSTMAHYWILQAVGRAANKYSRPIRLPENRISEFTKMNRLTREYEMNTNYTDRQILDAVKKELGLTDKEVTMIRNAAQGPINIFSSDTDSDNEHGISAESLMVPFAKDSAEADFMSSEVSNIVMDSINTLPQENASVIRSYFGFTDSSGNVSTPKQIRSAMKISHRDYKLMLQESLDHVRSDFERSGLSAEDI